MLGKLIKYELRATARYFLPLYIILFCMTIMNRIFMAIPIFDHGYFKMIPALFMTLYVVICIATIIATFIIMILRFYQNLVTDEGYLMFTLPVKTHSIILSKLLISAFWEVISVLVVVSSIFALIITPALFSELSTGLQHLYNEVLRVMGAQTALIIIETFIMIVLTPFYGILMIYSSIAIGQAFSRRKILSAIVAFIAIQMILQFASSILMVFVMAITGLNDTDPSIIYTIIYPITISTTLLLGAVFFFITNYIFKNKLNLE